MPAHACARAPPLAAGRPAPGRARAWAWVLVPYLAWFFLNRVSKYGPNQLRSRTGPDRLRCQVANLLDCQQSRTNWTANGCKPVGLPKVANQLDVQRLQWLGRKVAIFQSC